MPPKPGPFAFTELQTVTSLGRGEIRECINRGIISAPAGVGQGNRRAHTKWNLVEGVIAASLLRQVRAGAVAHAMTRLRWMLEHFHIDPDDYCQAPSTFDFAILSWSFRRARNRTIKWVCHLAMKWLGVLISYPRPVPVERHMLARG